jgi:hypothetical protein
MSFSEIKTDAQGEEYIEEVKERTERSITIWKEYKFVEEIQKINDQIQELQARKAELAQQQNKFKKGP